MRNKRASKIEIGKRIPRSPDEQVLWLNTNNESISRYIESTREWVSVSGSGGPAGDLVVPTAIKDSNNNDFITFERTGTGTARIGTPQDDLSLRSARDITLFAGDEGPGNVYIGWGDAVYTPDSPNRVATIGDIQSGTTGDITFDGIEIRGAGTASGDGYNNGTIELVPDPDLYINDQYLIIDPTNPNHIHIRAGGTQDESNADLILGGERNHVYIEDDARSVSISTRTSLIQNAYTNQNAVTGSTFITTMPANIQVEYTVNVGGTDYALESVTLNDPFEGFVTVVAPGANFNENESYSFTYNPPYNNYWNFNSEGVFSGPAMGGVKVPAIANSADGNDLYVYANNADVNIQAQDGKVVLKAGDGEFLNDSTNPDNQIATIGDLANIGSSDTPVTSVVYVDYLRQDSYTETGSQLYPYKTLADALDKAGTLSPSATNPIRIVLVSGNTVSTAETITINTGNIFIVGKHSSGTNALIRWYGQITFNGSGVSINDNQFSISGLSIIAVSDTTAITFTGSNPQNLLLKDLWLTGNGDADAMIINNGAASTVHGKDLKISHNGSGNYYAIKTISGALTLDSIESVGGWTPVLSVGDSVRLSNSEIISYGTHAIEFSTGGSLTMTHCKLTTTAEDSVGIKLNTGNATLSNVFFDIQVYGNDARAVSGFTGSTLRYSYLTFSPFGGNDKISSAITSIAMDTTPSFVS